jgi:NADPH-dependent curcumin reductase
MNGTRIVLAARPKGTLAASDFRRETIAVPQPGPGQILLRALYLSLDPYMRRRMDDVKSYAPSIAIGEVMVGESISEVVESNHADFKPGDIVLAHTGWQTHAVSNGKGVRKRDPALAPITTALGVLGMPGFTAYSGMRVIGQPKRGETVVVAAATGPVGSLVGQLAKRAGARAVAIAGGQEKCDYALKAFGFDAAVDHRTPDLIERLAAACPKGIDVYFENVGGRVARAVLPLLNRFARAPVCGLISYYNEPAGAESKDNLPALMRDVLTKSLTIRGFINYDFNDLYPDFLSELAPAVRSGEIRYKEDIVDGLENAPAAFMGLLEGKNFGKVLMKIAS